MSIYDDGPTETNRTRANWAVIALEAFGKQTGQNYTDGTLNVDADELREVAGDLLANLFHLARINGIAPEAITEAAYLHFAGGGPGGGTRGPGERRSLPGLRRARVEGIGQLFPERHTLTGGHGHGSAVVDDSAAGGGILGVGRGGQGQGGEYPAEECEGAGKGAAGSASRGCLASLGRGNSREVAQLFRGTAWPTPRIRTPCWP